MLYDVGSTTPVLSLTLPPGFEWYTPPAGTGTYPANYTTQATGGDFADMSTADSLGTITAGTSSSAPNCESYDVLTADYATTGNTAMDGQQATTAANWIFTIRITASTGGQWIQFTGQITVSNATQAQTGPINVTVTGLASSTVSTLEVGTYSGGTYSATTTNVGTASTIVAGKAAQAVGEFELQESAPGSSGLGPDDHPDPAQRCGLGAGTDPRQQQLHQHRQHRKRPEHPGRLWATTAMRSSAP